MYNLYQYGGARDQTYKTDFSFSFKRFEQGTMVTSNRLCNNPYLIAFCTQPIK